MSQKVLKKADAIIRGIRLRYEKYAAENDNVFYSPKVGIFAITIYNNKFDSTGSISIRVDNLKQLKEILKELGCEKDNNEEYLEQLIVKHLRNESDGPFTLVINP